MNIFNGLKSLPSNCCEDDFPQSYNSEIYSKLENETTLVVVSPSHIVSGLITTYQSNVNLARTYNSHVLI